MNSNDLWEALGSLDNDQAYQILIQLFARYEEQQERRPDDPEAQAFFQALATIISQVQSCNVSRR